MSSVTVAENQITPIELQIANGDTGKFPRAIIRNQANSIITTRDLSHLADGLYKGTNFLMPQEVFISVQYLIFEDSGRTVPASNLGIDTDIFVREPVSAQRIKVDQVFKVLVKTDKIGVKVKEEDKVSVQSVSNQLKVSVKKDEKITGVVKQATKVSVKAQCKGE